MWKNKLQKILIKAFTVMNTHVNSLIFYHMPTMVTPILLNIIIPKKSKLIEILIMLLDI